eukprot:3412397-Rhodomonas_salina.1
MRTLLQPRTSSHLGNAPARYPTPLACIKRSVPGRTAGTGMQHASCLRMRSASSCNPRSSLSHDLNYGTFRSVRHLHGSLVSV